MDNDKLMSILKHRPEVYEKGGTAFWDDDHISKSMLEAHLDPETDAASRKPDFIRRSVQWIAGYAEGREIPKLLDLGCGPGLYAALFAESGFDVTGIDISRRALDYARAISAQNGNRIAYMRGNYLDMDFDGVFDIITLIYCDFGVLCPVDRAALLRRIYKALKPGGRFVVDVHATKHLENRPEEYTWHFSEGGFWSERPYACLYSFLRYDDTGTYADRYVIVEKDSVRCFNIWNHRFTAEELRGELVQAGFSEVALFGSAAGELFKEPGNTICAVARA